MYKREGSHEAADKKNQEGFGIIEVLITAFIIGVVITGLFGLFVLALRSSQESERRIVAVALADERAEMIRNLPYQDVGTVGGVPSGAIAQNEVISRNGLEYNVKTDIRYIDDPFDGKASDSPPDTVNTDYKQARIEVGWNSNLPVKPVLLITVIVPQGIEGGDAAGTLVFQALDSAGNAIPQTDVELINDSATPAIDITTQTNEDGEVIIPGLPEGSQTYQLLVSKSGYNSEQTYDVDPTFFPDTDHSHLTFLAGEITSKTFQIDHVGSIVLHFVNDSDEPVPGVAYHFQGGRTIGTDNLGNLVYVVDDTATSDTTGGASYTNLAWDTYQLSIDGAATGYDIKETSKILPFALNPSEDADVQVVLVDHVPLSLHVTVTSPEGDPVDNATVHVMGPNGYDQTLGTGVYGQVFFSDLTDLGDYTVGITAPGYEASNQTVPIDGSERVSVPLNPSA